MILARIYCAMFGHAAPMEIMGAREGDIWLAMDRPYPEYELENVPVDAVVYKGPVAPPIGNFKQCPRCKRHVR